jgi:hypothetical protein
MHLKASPDAEGGINVSKTSVRFNGNAENFVMANEQGVTIGGPISMVAGTSQIRVGGLWVFNNPAALSIPSCLATPTPVLIIDPPVGQLASLVKQAGAMIALLGALVAGAA